MWKLALVWLCLYKYFMLHTLLACPKSWSCYSYFSLVYIHFNLVFVPDSLHLFRISSTYSVLNMGSQAITSLFKCSSFFHFLKSSAFASSYLLFVPRPALLPTTACSSSSQPQLSECVAISVANTLSRSWWAVRPMLWRWHAFWVKIRE